MATTASSNPSELYDPIRKLWVAATPEEQVRQQLIARMLQAGYPKGLLAVEVSLKRPKRRVDLVCYQSSGEPLLIIECKALPLGAAWRQVLGYNHYLQAPFIGVANQCGIRIGWQTADGYQFSEQLPTYQSLVASI